MVNATLWDARGAFSLKNHVRFVNDTKKLNKISNYADICYNKLGLKCNLTGYVGVGLQMV